MMTGDSGRSSGKWIVEPAGNQGLRAISPVYFPAAISVSFPLHALMNHAATRSRAPSGESPVRPIVLSRQLGSWLCTSSMAVAAILGGAIQAAGAEKLPPEEMAHVREE